ncbi:6093_t:CDS:1, partial [Acaulospora morrowiae]
MGGANEILFKLLDPVPQYVLGCLPALAIIGESPANEFTEKITWLLRCLGCPFTGIFYSFNIGGKGESRCMYWLSSDKFEIVDSYNPNEPGESEKHDGSGKPNKIVGSNNYGKIEESDGSSGSNKSGKIDSNKCHEIEESDKPEHDKQEASEKSTVLNEPDESNKPNELIRPFGFHAKKIRISNDENIKKLIEQCTATASVLERAPA